MRRSEAILFVLAFVALLMLVRWIQRGRPTVSETAWLPKVLRDSELIYAEKMFRARGPIEIVAHQNLTVCNCWRPKK